MNDETPKRPDEKDDAMTDDESDPHVPEVTRREAMSTPAKAALGGAGVLGLLGLSTSTASAQQSVEEPAQLLRDDQDREVWWRIDDAGDLVLVHGPSGAEFRYDTEIDAWTTNATFDLGGNDVQNVGSFDSESVTTEVLNNNISFLNPDFSQSDWQAELDRLKADGGGLAVPLPGTYVVEDLTVPSNVTLDPLTYLGATFKLPDNADGSLPVLRVEAGGQNATIRNVEVDGNEAQNSGEYGTVGLAHGIHVGPSAIGNDDRPSDCRVESVYVHDTLRSCVNIAGEDNELEDARLHNAATDHHLYISHGKGNTAEGLRCSGFANTGCIVVGGNDTSTDGTTLRDVRVTSLAQTPESKNPRNAIELREPDSGTTAETTVENVTLDNPGAGGAGILNKPNHPATIEDVEYTGEFDFSPGVIDTRSEGTVVSKADVTVTGTTQSSTRAVELKGANSTARDVRVREPNTSVVVGVYMGADGATADTLDISTGGPAVEAYTSGTDRTIGIWRLDTDNSSRVSLNGDTGSLYLADGCMIPQRASDISTSRLYDGYEAFNDGGGGNTKGPAFWEDSASNWVSEVDGTTWT